MTPYPKLLALLLAALIALPAAASSDVAPGMIVRLNATAGELSAALNGRAFVVERELSRSMRLYQVKTSRAGASPLASLRELRANPSIAYAQLNHRVSRRSVEAVPDDPLFGELWALRNVVYAGSDIQAPRAWALGTGGKDTRGNEIVIAVVDDGLDVRHGDLSANLWRNAGEIAGDGLDNDGNGYVDDLHGWNATKDNGTFRARRHGTHVAGIMAADGNNGLQTTGVNWRTSLMAIEADSETAEVVRGYGYLIAMKKLWLESKGARGANVVVANSSFGIDLVHCDSGDYPVWNDLYDEMGKLGILSVIATSNIGHDVDVKGDVPATCPSEYLIAVTRTKPNDKRVPEAGFGKRSIDLAAPGEDILSTVPGNAVMKMHGTSMAAPFVAGSVGLLHHQAGQAFNDFYLEDPARAALAMKSMILGGVDPLPDLQGITVAGGRLNLFRSARLMQDFRR